MSNDYELELKVKNAPMLNRMRLMGYDSAAQLHRACGVAQSVISKMLNLSRPLYGKNDTPGKDTIKVCACLKTLPEDIYPESHYYASLEENKFTAQVAAGDMKLMARDMSAQDPSSFLEMIQEDFDINDIIDGCDSITPREKDVLMFRFSQGATLEETGRRLDLSRERTRQVEAKGLRKLRNQEDYEKNSVKKYLDIINEGGLL